MRQQRNEFKGAAAEQSQKVKAKKPHATEGKLQTSEFTELSKQQRQLIKGTGCISFSHSDVQKIRKDYRSVISDRLKRKLEVLDWEG